MVVRRYLVTVMGSTHMWRFFTLRGALKMCRKHYAHACVWQWNGNRWKPLPWQALIH